MAAVAVTAFFMVSTTAAHADVMAAGTWDGQITGGAVSLGDGDLRSIPVPAGDPFSFTVPAGSTSPVAFKAPAVEVPIPLMTETEDDTLYAVGGHLNLSPIAGTVDPLTGVATGTATGHGVLHLSSASLTTPGATSSIYCYFGADPAPGDDPAPPAPFALNLTAGLTDATFAVNLDCGAPFITPDTDLRIIGHPAMASGMNELHLTATFTRRPDPVQKVLTAPKTTPPTTTAPPVVVECVVPKLTGLKLTKARRAAAKANCTVGKVKRKKSGRRTSTVLKQGARRGTVLTQGARITLTVAK
jgi:hypothetical protein